MCGQKKEWLEEREKGYIDGTMYVLGRKKGCVGRGKNGWKN